MEEWIMERYKEISFLAAMNHLAEGDIKDIYFKNNDDIVPVKNYRVYIDTLTKKQWFLREVID